MRIIHVMSGLTKGGAQRVLVELANKAIEKGDDVTVISGWPEDPVIMQNSLSQKVNIKFVGPNRKLAYLNIVFWIIRHRKLIGSHDVLHCHLTFGAFFGTMSSILLKKILRFPLPVVVETYHAVGMPIPKFNKWFHFQMAKHRSGLVLMATDPDWDNFIEQHPRMKIEVIQNGISIIESKKSVELHQKFRKELAIPDEVKYLVGTVGMLRPERNPWMYIPIFKDINEALGNQVHFILAGDGTEFENIKSLVESNGLSDKIHLPGLVNDPVITISNLDIYVSFSVGKAAGISMIEAAMCNIPVIGIQLTDNYFAQNGDWVWSHTDIKEVARKIIFLLQNETERQQLARDQMLYVSTHFTSEIMYHAYDSFYKNILAQ